MLPESWLVKTKQPPLASVVGNPRFDSWCKPRAVVTADILEALVFLHTVGKGKQGIIHRDIKMANVLVNVDGGNGLEVRRLLARP